MRADQLQQQLDQVRATSGQRLALGAAAVAAAIVACAAADAAAAHHHNATILYLSVVALAVAAAWRPDLHTAGGAIVAVVCYWWAVVDDLATPWSLVVGLTLFCFHTIVALLGMTPHSGVVDMTTLARWLRRSIVPATSTVAMWCLVRLFEDHRSDGNAALVLIALLALAAAAIALRTQSVDRTE